MKRIIYLAILLLAIQLHAQTNTVITGKIIDAASKEALQGVTITDKQHIAITNASGSFSLTSNSNTIVVSMAGYLPQTITLKQRGNVIISLQQAVNLLDQVVVSANKTAQKRSEAPVAITTINKQTIDDTKANRIDHLLNKVSGVFDVNLGNEQHEMSIRQPLTTKSLFLYLEDGIPIRTTGVYNHNALLEMNTTAAKSIEVIKGPSSSLYGAEAIGGAVNVLTQAPPSVANGLFSTRINNNGYKRIDAQAGNTFGKLGILVSGYYANRINGPVEQTNFHKTAFTVRGDYTINEKTKLTNTLTYVDYYSDMGGGSLDSAHFANKNYSTLYTFNYRITTALRIKSQLSHVWNSNSESQITVAYRNNSVKQNPSYYVTNNFSNPLLANGQVNNSSFNSYMLIAQHAQKMNWLQSKLIVGVSTDISPSTYVANDIKIQRNAAGKYASFNTTDSVLSNYKTGISNVASYVNYDAFLAKGLKLIAALRYDFYHYNFQNYLTPSASSGAPSTITNFSRATPKIGLTYNHKSIGFYGNYSEGYVPPQVGELFNIVKVPYLQPQTFFNYEMGGWLSLVQNTLYLDYSLYLLNGTNEIISVRQTDGSYQNQNSGQTRHKGIEYGITYRPNDEWMIRFSGTNATHTFVQDIEKGIDYSGNEIAGAPKFIANGEIMYKPIWVKGLRLGAEWQHLSNYFLDNANTGKYAGFDVFNIRTGYSIKHFEVWVNALNAFNKYYSVLASKSSYGYTYNLGDPREITLGVSVKFGK
ncbi:TonB-dependent receptor domain-containing protein [Parasediminibacterium paludis]|uniref:TonB-dependent receptor domain-containing protein n=1 Tax=Parasediminibacterium paludis TaxID=908966 RepID=A0ABV8Q1R5_9BACT